MKYRIGALITAFLFLPWASRVFATQVTLPPSDDSYVSSAAGPDNYGTREYTVLHRNAVGVNEYPLYKFNLQSIPSGVTIDSATLYLWNRSSDSTQDVTLQFYKNTANWYESDVKWINKPSYESTSINFTISTAPNEWKQFDITSLARNWAINPGSNYGISIRGPASGSYLSEFSSDESSTNRPYLGISYSTPTPTPTATPIPTPTTMQGTTQRPTATSTPKKSTSQTPTPSLMPSPTITPVPQLSPTPTSTPNNQASIAMIIIAGLVFLGTIFVFLKRKPVSPAPSTEPQNAKVQEKTEVNKDTETKDDIPHPSP